MRECWTCKYEKGTTYITYNDDQRNRDPEHVDNTEQFQHNTAGEKNEIQTREAEKLLLQSVNISIIQTVDRMLELVLFQGPNGASKRLGR